MDDIAAWLERVGLGQHAELFRANDITAAVLPELTDEDLRQLGLSLGHRRLLLKAINDRAQAASEAALLPPASAGEATILRPEAERRQLTVMFVDLVGSTALAARLDPEDMRAVITAYQNACSEIIRRYEGHVAKFMGDGVLAYFGYPRAHEDEAERAVRAGLTLVATVGRLKAPAGEALAARIGIATGLVVVGDLVGEGAAQEQAVIGETPNLAARLQAVAEPGRVVVAEATRRLLGAGFELADLGETVLKGISEPVATFAVIGERPTASRFEARSGPALLPMVGRDQELALLLERWAQAKVGDGQGVLLVGEAGIGKSRISRALLDAVAAEPHVRVRYQCSPYHTDSALWPVIQQLGHAAGFVVADPPEARLDKLEALLARAGGARAAAPLIADLLGLDGTTHYGKLDLAPHVRRARTLEALVEQMLGLAAKQPVLVILEDAHWIDPTTLELIEQGLDRIAAASVLILQTSRPDNQPRLAAHPHVTRLTLNRLGRAGVEAIVARLGGDQLPTDTVGAIIARTDGVPLFVEELTKAVLETGETAIPASLHDSLMARLDRTPEVKEIAQTAACIGREFDYALLAAIADKPEPALATALDRLSAAELAFRRGTPPEARYTFKHTLVRDAAYQSLLRSKRQQVHSRIAQVLEERFAETAATQPELLAYHFAEARQIERAIDYWLKAGERAAERSANLEAIRHLTRGLEALGTLPECAARDRRELAFQIAIGTSSIAVYGYAAPQTGAAYHRARVLGERLGDVESLVATLSGEFVYSFVRGDYPAMRRLVDEARQVSERLPDPVVRLAGHRLAGIAAMHFGAFAEARCEFEAILRLYDASRHRSQPVHFVHDPKVSALTYLAPVLWILGFPEQAHRSSVAASRCAAELNQANLTAHVHNFAGAGLNELLRNVPAVRAHADAIVELADRHNLGYWRVNGLILRGWAMAHEGAAEPGLALMRQNTTDRAALGVSWYQTRYLCMLAEVHARLCQAELGLRVVAEARDLLARNDEHMWEGEVERIEGELLRVQGASVPAIEACFARAIAGARQQAAKSLELRAATSLARLWVDHGKRAEARDLLAPVYDWFTEGFETQDLKDVRALLEELR
jgi:predicted ATPase/class 3 adenylate cyclase